MAPSFLFLRDFDNPGIWAKFLHFADKNYSASGIANVKKDMTTKNNILRDFYPE